MTRYHYCIFQFQCVNLLIGKYVYTLDIISSNLNHRTLGKTFVDSISNPLMQFFVSSFDALPSIIFCLPQLFMLIAPKLFLSSVRQSLYLSSVVQLLDLLHAMNFQGHETTINLQISPIFILILNPV